MKFKELLEDWRGFHQPINPDKYPDEVSRGDNIFTLGIAPFDLYQHAYDYYLNVPSVSKIECNKFMDFLKKNQGNPNAKIKIYRGQPSEILEYNSWVTPFKSYAMEYAYGNAYDGGNSKVYEYIVNLHDISCDLDSIAEWGYFGKNIKGKEIL